MKKLLGIILVVSLTPVVCVAAEAQQAEESAEKMIEINGENRKLMWHISKENIWRDKEHLKSVDFYRIFPDKKDTYVLIAKGHAPCKEKDLDDAIEGNYVFGSFYKIGQEGELRAVVIFGTKDPKHIKEINFAVLGDLLRPLEQ